MNNIYDLIVYFQIGAAILLAAGSIVMFFKIRKIEKKNQQEILK